MTSKASATATTLATSGMSSPPSPSGYPSPSNRSWWWLIAGSAPARALTGETISTPSEGGHLIFSYSSSVRRRRGGRAGARPRARRGAYRRDDRAPERGVAPHLPVLLLGQAGGLVEYVVGD